MTTEELLKAGILAAKAGQTTQASNLLIQVVKTDPRSELGWFWLGICRTVPSQREYCFRQVLSINPQHAEARRQLEFLQKPAPQIATPPEPAKGPNLVHTPPFTETPRELLPENQKPVEKPPAQKNLRSKPRKSNNGTLIWFGAAFVVFVCVAAAGILALGSMFNSTATPPTLLPPSPTVVPVTPTPSYTPVFETAPCDFAVPNAARVDCGFVIVPEDRSADLSDTIKLAVALYRSTSPTPKSDPILYLAGGPGGEAINWSAAVYSSVIAPLLSERDFIIFDPRGVGRSQPVLNCDEFGKTYLQDLQGHIPADQRASYYEGALLGCKNNLTQQGANLSAYTSIDMAADAKDVLRALGYQQGNFYGISYGTRVAQIIMRQYPEVVRSAVLDSVVPVEVQLLSQSATERGDVLRVLFDDCKLDPACAAAYPELEAAYHQAFDQLNSQPVQVTVTLDANRKLQQSIDGYTFHNAILWALRTSQTISLVPQLIYRVRDGDHSTLLLSLALPVIAFDSISMGSYISVNCHDQVFAIPLEQLDTTIHDMCKLWDVKPPLPGENDPVQSDIPTLIFAGRYDTTTPPAFAHQLAGHLTHSYIAEIPNQGHAPSATGISDCPVKLIAAFLQDPSVGPDLTCARETQMTKFVVPFDVNAPIVLESATIEQYQIQTRVPSGWTKANFGFYNRSGFMGDITQIGIQSTPISEADWLAWLSTNFQVSKGLDGPATKSEERVANGLKWSIYRTSAQGQPVVMGFAKSGGETLMVLMYCHQDEYEALFNNVFLPVLESTAALR